jgi:predicted MPP superfamily phosphohydrolase
VGYPAVMGGAVRKISLWAAGLLVVGIGVAGATAWKDTTVPRLAQVRIPVPGITREYRFLQVSDLHGARFGTGQAQLRDLIAGRKYDAVLLTGDMLDRQTEDPAPERELIEALRRASPLVVGVYLDDYSRSIGVPDLQDAKTVRIGEIDLTSLANPAYPRIPPADDGALAVVALSHDPLSDSDLRRFKSAEPRLAAVVAGHLHGGQIRVPFIGALAIPRVVNDTGRVWLPETKGVQVRGLERREGVWVSLSNGLGTQPQTRLGSLTRFRFLAPAEVTEVVLVPDL